MEDTSTNPSTLKSNLLKIEPKINWKKFKKLNIKLKQKLNLQPKKKEKKTL